MSKYLIFGATGSIGTSLSEQLNKSNKEIHLVGRKEDELESLSAKLDCDYSVLDILSENLSEFVKEEFGSMDISGVAYCIGSIDLKPLKNSKKEDFKKCLDLNFFPVIEIIKSLQDSLKKNNGSIVLFSTVAVQKRFTNHAIIASTKAAVEGLTVSLAAEFAPNIRVNCIAPSLTHSKIAEPMLKNKALADGIAKAHPLKRLGEGKDSASLAKFLISEDSSWITGQIIAVDGGRSKLS